MPISREELDQFREGKLLLQCPKLRLIRREKTKPSSISGAGDIRLSPDRILLLRLYGTRMHSRETPWARLLEEAQLPSGVLLPESSYYDLEAVDFKGRRWRTKRLRPDISYASTGNSFVEAQVSSLKEVERYTPKKKHYSLTLFAFEDFEIPTNSTVKEMTSIAGSRTYTRFSRNVWKFRVCGIDFLLTRHRSQQLEVQAYSDRKVPRFLRERIAGTLQFLLGRPFPWSISMEVRSAQLTTELRSRAWLPPSPRHRPPLPPESITTPQSPRRLTVHHHRRLFELFLRHTLPTEKQRHPLWGDLNAVYEASAGRFIDAQALTLTVVIEALLAREFPGLGEPSKALRRAVEVTSKHIEDLHLNPSDVKARIRGAIRQVLGRTAHGRLRELVRKGAITDVQRKSWSELRNASTHAYQLQRLSSAEHRDLLRINEVLFTHLIFHAIGYRGLYMDYSKDGWPLRAYPEEGN